MPRSLKHEGEPLVARSLKFPSSLWQKLEERVPAEARSDFIREAVERKLAEAPRPQPGRERAERVRAARGVLAGASTSVEAFCRDKAEEIAIEERRMGTGGQ